VITSARMDCTRNWYGLARNDSVPASSIASLRGSVPSKPYAARPHSYSPSTFCVSPFTSVPSLGIAYLLHVSSIRFKPLQPSQAGCDGMQQPGGALCRRAGVSTCELPIGIAPHGWRTFTQHPNQRRAARSQHRPSEGRNGLDDVGWANLVPAHVHFDLRLRAILVQQVLDPVRCGKW